MMCWWLRGKEVAQRSHVGLWIMHIVLAWMQTIKKYHLKPKWWWQWHMAQWNCIYRAMIQSQKRSGKLRKHEEYLGFVYNPVMSVYKWYLRTVWDSTYLVIWLLLKCEPSFEIITPSSPLPSLITLFNIPSESPWCKGSPHTVEQRAFPSWCL